MKTYLHENANGVLVEYRRRLAGVPSAILWLECRVLRSDGTPHDDQWYRVSDAELTYLQKSGSDIVSLFCRR